MRPSTPIAALLLLGSNVFALTISGPGKVPPQPHLPSSDDPCSSPFLYTYIQSLPSSPIPSADVVASTSSAQLCCDLCHHSETDCYMAQWTSATEKCILSVKDTKTAWPKDINVGAPTGTCPAGVLQNGMVNNEVGAWEAPDGFMVGPCWSPVDGGPFVEVPEEDLPYK